MIDFHSHILPYLDDGAPSIAAALEMARISVQSGVTTMVATPHANQRGRFENYVDATLQASYHEFVTLLAQEQIPLRIIPGMEIFATPDLLKRLQQGQLCGIGHSNHYLVEFPFMAYHGDVTIILEQMLHHGYTPLIAHPERYACVHENVHLLHTWREMGCKLQLNKGSVFGGFGTTARYVARWMLAKDMVDVAGSDAHDTRHRTTNMQHFAEYITEQYSAALCHKILITNPTTILNERTQRPW